MTTTLATPSMTGQEIVDLTKKHTLFEWSAQSKVDPIPVAKAKGIYFWTPEGKRFIDFNSQLMSVNIGHGDERVIRAISEQAATLCLRQSVHGDRAARAPGREARRDYSRRHRHVSSSPTAALRRTRTRSRSRASSPDATRSWRATARITARRRAAISLTGDPRRWAAEPGIPGVVRVLDPYHGIERGWESAETSLAMIEETMQLEGPHTIAAFILETVVGTNGILIPPDGYMQGVRKLCDKYGILMIADEVMAGFGRTGEWFAIDHWKVVPDLICMAKGLTSSYLPLGAVGMRHHIAQHFQDKVFYGGLTYNSHPMGCAAALATIRVYEEDHLIENAKKMGAIMKDLGAELQAKHPSVGAVRSIGLFGIVELVRSRKTRQPMAPFNGTSEEMAALGRFFREQGLYTLVRWNTFYTNPPLCINEQQLREAFAIIDKGLEITDKAVKD